MKNPADNMEHRIIGGPLDGLTTELHVSYLDAEGNPIKTEKGDKIRISGKGGLYYLRAGYYYEWNNR